MIRGAREHNLRDVSLTLPRGKLICLTGVSGSGKSSLAFDTLYAEGQRRYVESLSSYARQFLGQMPKPEVDRIDGLSPSISIQQKTGGRNPRSRSARSPRSTTTCGCSSPGSGRGIARTAAGPWPPRPASRSSRGSSRPARRDRLPDAGAGRPRPEGGIQGPLRRALAAPGYVRARVNGQVVNLSDNLSLDRQIKHNIEVVIDRLKAAANGGPPCAGGWPRRSSRR